MVERFERFWPIANGFNYGEGHCEDVVAVPLSADRKLAETRSECMKMLTRVGLVCGDVDLVLERRSNMEYPVYVTTIV